MSRSFKKPYYTCGYGGTYKKFAKRQANKRIRKSDIVSNNGFYKRLYCSWDICDYIFYCPDDKKAYRK